MAENSLIAWTHNTANAWMGCVKKSDGCKNCYAETLVKNRMGKPELWGPAGKAKRQRTSAAKWAEFKRWNRKAEAHGVSMRVFLGSLMDWAETHPDLTDVRTELWQLIRETPFIQWQMLTKRPENIASLLPDDWGDYGYHNVWLGTSIESMDATEILSTSGERRPISERADRLRAIPAAVRFISYEPALGPLSGLDLKGIDWVIFGGESGPGYRPMKIEWADEMRAMCADSGTAFFFKQSAAHRTEMGTTLHGETVRNYPIPRSATKTFRHVYHRMTEEAFKAQRRRSVLDLQGKPNAPFYDETHENTKRATARAGQPLPLLDAEAQS